MATNTSAIPCREICKTVKNTNKFAGLHFSNPAAIMKLVEIIRVDNGTDDDTYSALVQFVEDIGKVGVTSKDTPGFIINRLLIPYVFSAIEILERGHATAKDIDTAAKLGAGYPMGPFEQADLAGLDTLKLASDTFLDTDGNRICKRSELLNKLVREGKLGKKTGEGFHKYDGNASKTASG